MSSCAIVLGSHNEVCAGGATTGATESGAAIDPAARNVYDKGVRGDVAVFGIHHNRSGPLVIEARFQTPAETSGRSAGRHDGETEVTDFEVKEADRPAEEDGVSHEAKGLVHPLLPHSNPFSPPT